MDGTYHVDNACTTPLPSYLVVSNTPGYNRARFLSISGRDYYCSGNQMQYSFYDGYTTTLGYKDIVFANCNLRLGRNNTENANNVIVSPNPFSAEVTLNYSSEFSKIKVFDMTGNLLLCTSGNEEVINRSLNELAILLPKGIYLLRLESENGNIAVNKKLIKM